MSADFLAGYLSGAIGIIIGNPLDLIKVRLQATPSPNSPIPTTSTAISPTTQIPTTATNLATASHLIRGVSAPILGYGALNALLFVTYNRTSSLLTSAFPPLVAIDGRGGGGIQVQASLWTTFIAGAVGGLATWVISTPTELVKVRAQTSPSTSWAITKEVLRREGVRGLYLGGVVTALRDSVGYGFYFWSYEISTRFLANRKGREGEADAVGEAAKVLLCGGIAGVVTWASIFPLDVVKTRVQTQVALPRVLTLPTAGEAAPLLSEGATANGGEGRGRRLGTMEIARNAYRTEGASVFWRGLGVCCARAFVVNAVQWAVYEWALRKLEPGKGMVEVVGGMVV